MLYLTCTTIIIVDLAHYGVSRAKDLVSVDCGTNYKSNSFSKKRNYIHFNEYLQSVYEVDCPNLFAIHGCYLCFKEYIK